MASLSLSARFSGERCPGCYSCNDDLTEIENFNCWKLFHVTCHMIAVDFKLTMLLMSTVELVLRVGKSSQKRRRISTFWKCTPVFSCLDEQHILTDFCSVSSPSPYQLLVGFGIGVKKKRSRIFVGLNLDQYISSIKWSNYLLKMHVYDTWRTHEHWR